MPHELWSSLLRESSKRTKGIEGVCVFVGDSGCGKSHLIEKLCVQETKNQTSITRVDKEIISYNTFEIDEAISNVEVSPRVGVWSFSDKCFNNALDIVVLPQTEKVRSFMFLCQYD